VARFLIFKDMGLFFRKIVTLLKLYGKVEKLLHGLQKVLILRDFE